jgi:hypothetical protein
MIDLYRRYDEDVGIDAATLCEEDTRLTRQTHPTREPAVAM